MIFILTSQKKNLSGEGAKIARSLGYLTNSSYYATWYWSIYIATQNII